MRARALAVALFAACSSSPTGYAFDVDARFKPASRDAFLHAQDAWNAITNADHQLSIDGGDWRVAAEWPSPECGRHDSNAPAPLRPNDPSPESAG